MAIVGADRFREAFASYGDRFVLIGGVAAELWLSEAGIDFRATKDFDIVLIAEALDGEFVRRFWAFADEGGYQIARADGEGVLYRFTKPTAADFPVMLELFSRRPELLELPPEQTASPIPTGPDHWSLSAILMDDAYYELVLNHRESAQGLPIVSVPCLILLRASAWLDLFQRREGGESVDEKHIKKHRNDVFKLATLLTPGDTWTIDTRVHKDLSVFLDSFPADSRDWVAIKEASGMKGRMPSPVKLLEVLRAAFRENWGA